MVFPVWVRNGSGTCTPMKYTSGTRTHHATNEPAQMMAAYRSPTMYPSPSTAAPMFSRNSQRIDSASRRPQPNTVVETTSFQAPMPETRKS